MKRSVVTAAAGLAVASLALTGCGGAATTTNDSSSGSDKLVVWNWGASTDAEEEYTQAVVDLFNEEHPDVEVEVVSQPFDQYYTLLGTAMEAGTGPDIALFNGGTQLKSRADMMADLTDELADLHDTLAGWDAFEVDGVTYSAPISLQGFPVYVNKAVLEEAGVDAGSLPTTWDELTDVCDAVNANTDKACIAMGNKEGLGIEFFLSGFGSGVFTPEEYDAWLAGDRDWESEHAKQILQMWADTSADGWYNDGANSTAMFMDMFNLFWGGDAAMVIGLVSQWAQFDEYQGDDLGFMMPVTVNDGTTVALPVEGGIGYAVLNEGVADLGADFVRATVDHDLLQAYSDGGGQVVSDTTVELATDNEAATEMISELPGSKPLLHTALGGDTLDLLHRLGQQLLIGEVTVDDAASQLAASEG